MELRHLRYFAAVAETLNFSRAAEHLHVAQPALSRQIRQLEDEIGVLLIDRQHTPVQLTDAGRVFEAHVAKLLMQTDIAVTAAQEAGRGHEGRLVICGVWWLGLDVLPESIVDFRKCFPRIDLELRELPLYEQVSALHEGEINLGFLPRRHLARHEDLEYLEVIESEWILVLPVAHPLAQKEMVRLVDLKKERFLVIESPTVRAYRDAIVQLCRLAQFSPLFGKRSTTREGMYALAASGYGVILAPHHTLPPRHTSLRYLPTDCTPMELCAVWRRDDQSIPLERFLEIIRRHVEAPDAG